MVAAPWHRLLKSEEAHPGSLLLDLRYAQTGPCASGRATTSLVAAAGAPRFPRPRAEPPARLLACRCRHGLAALLPLLLFCLLI